jgi:amino acid transporter
MATASEPHRAGAAPRTMSETGEFESPLRRVLGLRLLTLFILGDVLGAGIYALVGTVAAETGGAIWTAFTVALILAVFTAFSYAELVTKYPEAGGAAVYVHRAFGRPFFTFMVAFAVMASGIASAATLATAFGGTYLAEFIENPTVLASLLFIVVVAFINFRGISESVRINVGLTLIELTGLLIIVAIGAAALLNGEAEPARNFEFATDSSVPLAIFGGAALSFYALIGFEDSVNVAEECRDPSRNFPKALFGGLLLAGIIYLLVTFTASMVVPTATLAGSDGALLEVVRAGPLGIPEKLFSAIALLAVANGALINLIMASRLVYGMAQQGIVPAAFRRVHEQRQTPWVAIVFTTALCAGLILLGDLSDLAATTVTLLLFVFAAVNVAVLVLRREQVSHRHFRAPSIFPVLGALVIVGLLTQREPRVFLFALGLLAIGLLFWVISRFVSRREATIDPTQLEG